MRSNRFGLSVVIQSVFLAVSGTAAFLICTGDYLLISKSSFVIIWVLQIFLLIRYVNRTNMDFARFLESLSHLDKPKLNGAGRSFRRLNLAYNRILEILRKERALRETEFHYFHDTIEHINTGLISFGNDGRIQFVNRAAQEILNCRTCNRIEQLGEKVAPVLPNAIQSLEPGRPQLVIYQNRGKIFKLSLNLALFKIQNQDIRVVSIVDIKGELEEGELGAWQKLLRILTHEIINTVTPINTLTNAMIGQLQKITSSDKDIIQKLSSGIQAIRKRNNGLLTFVQNFRRINKVLKPDFKTVRIEELFDHLKSFLNEEMKQIELIFNAEDNIIMEADEGLVIQVIINLLKNAVEAHSTSIMVIARYGQNNRPQILVSDNGQGIENENIDNVFVPFYSSKKDGSGIGLSLSRQIMRLHRGNISVESTVGSNTTFTLTF